LPFFIHKCQVCGVAGQPENQLVQEQDYSVVPETPRVPADDRQPIIQRYVRLVCPAGDLTIGGKEAVHEIAYETRTLLRSRGRGNRRLEASGIPRRRKRAPAATHAPGVERSEERFVAKPASHLSRVVEDAFSEIHARQRRLWM